MDNYKEIENIYLHDSELREIMINYFKKEVSLILVTAATSSKPSQTNIILNSGDILKCIATFLKIID